MEDEKDVIEKGVVDREENNVSLDDDIYQDKLETRLNSSDDKKTFNESMSLLEELELYVGPKKEAYYSTRFEDMIDTESKFGWNWPALFVPNLWMAYRKMYIESAILLIVSTVIGFLVEKVSFLHIISVIITFLIPAIANWLYFRHAKKDIENIRSVGQERKEEIIAKGGTSILAVFIFLAIQIIIPLVQFMNNPKIMNILNM